MGGQAEQVIQDKGKSTASTSVDIQQKEKGLQKIRVHLNKGEVHFHDDKNKLKAAIPVPVYWKAWQDLRNGKEGTWEYVDPDNKAKVVVTREDDTEVRVYLDPVEEFGPTFKALDKLASA